jgi:arsenate reductase
VQKKPKVLFLSRGNATRGQMAEGLLRSLAADRFDATSAGIEPGTLNPMAVEAMREAGVDISRQQAKNVKELLKEHFAYVITVCDLARERAPIFPFSRTLSTGVSMTLKARSTQRKKKRSYSGAFGTRFERR